MSYEENIICPHCDSTYSDEPYEYYDSDGNYYNRRVNCVNCDKYNYVDDDGNLEFKNI